MGTLGYDVSFTSTDYSSGDGRALGNHLAQLIAFGLQDGANEANGYANTVYEPLNSPDCRFGWQRNRGRLEPVAAPHLDLFIDQSATSSPEKHPFLSPEWGQVTSWASATKTSTPTPATASLPGLPRPWTARLARHGRLGDLGDLPNRAQHGRALVGMLDPPTG